MVFYALAATAISAAFALTLLVQYRSKPRPYLMAWSVALAIYAVAALTEVIGAAAGWSPLLYRTYYYFGGILVVGILALGTIYLLAPRFGRTALRVLLVLAAVGLAGTLGARLQPTLLQTHAVPSVDTIRLEHGAFNAVAILMAAVLNIVGSVRQQPATAMRPIRMLVQGGSMNLVKEFPDSDSQEEWLARERAHLSQVLYRYTPLVIDHAQGSYLYTVDGRRYLDFASGIGVTNLGHGHPGVVKAAHEQLDKLMHISVVAHHQPAIELAERIAALAPGNLDKVFFANSGAEAVEGAIKLARYTTGRPGLIAFQGAFHGRTYGALSLTASKGYYRERYEPLLPAVYHVPYPYPYRNPTGTDEAATLDYVFTFIDEMLDTRVPPKNVAAFIVEPVLGEGGYVVPPPAFMPRLRALCDRHGILLIADEVQSGYGRTGKMFASEHTGVVPDIMTLAKSIASGLPLSAVVASSKLMDQWEPAAHGSTFGGNPVSCAAGIATLDVFTREGILENAAARGAELMRRLRDLQRRLPAIGEVRGLGLMVGVELVNKDGSANKDLQKKVRQVCLDSGMVVLSCGPHDNVLRLVPPLNLSQAELDEGWEILNAAFQEVAA